MTTSATIKSALFLVANVALGRLMRPCVGFSPVAPKSLAQHSRSSPPHESPSALAVSELHIPGYAETKIPFILTDDDLVASDGGGAPVLTRTEPRTHTDADCSSAIPHAGGHLLHKSKGQVFTDDECQSAVNEAERIASSMGWTTDRHGNCPTTDMPIVELPETLSFLRKALVERTFPLLASQFGPHLPDPSRLRVADGFVVKCDAEGGQTELKPHRDGSVLSFNVALNSASEFDGGGTWFNGDANAAVKIDRGEMVSHASGILHGGHGITRGKRYILVAFVILEGFENWSMRFYNQIRDLKWESGQFDR